MKITTFNPEIISNNAEPIVKLFEELGFERRHTKTDVDERDITMIRMKDPNGFHVDVVNDPSAERDTTIIRMNVDNFGEAYEILEDYDFRNAKYNENAVFTENAKQAKLTSPTGFTIDLCYHIKGIFYNF